MKKSQSRNGNVIVVTMFCLILVMFIAAMFLDVGLIEVEDATSTEMADANAVTLVAKSSEKASQKLDVAALSGNRQIDAKSATDKNLVVSSKKDAANVVQSLNKSSLTELPNSDQAPSAASIDGSIVRQVLESLQNGTGWVSRQPRDIVFVVDLSGSMNDDTEPAWATQTLADQFAGTEFAKIGETLVQQFYNDMNFGAYPGKLEYIGAPLGDITENSNAYHQMTMNDGKLAHPDVAEEYRIDNLDDEETRKRKAYSWMIDNQIKRLMPAAKPTPDSNDNYEFWEKYLDYIMVVKFIGPPENKPKKKRERRNGGSGPVPGLGSNPALTPIRLASFHVDSQPLARLVSTRPTDERGWIPPNVDSNRIYKFNNPNKAAFVNVDSNTRWQLRNKIGYRSYAQFLLDWGRNGKPDGKHHVQSSANSPFCSFHDENVNGETFAFPPRTQPMHSVRRSLISALQLIRDKNYEFGMSPQRDLVSVLAFDNANDGVAIVQGLTDDYESAMKQCTWLQATGDIGSSTATEVGLKEAYRYLKPIEEGGVGRAGASKVVVLLTDGRPTAHLTTGDEIEGFIQNDSNTDEFYGGGYLWKDAVVMQSKIMNSDDWYIYPIGVGFGADFEFLDRLARLGSTDIKGEAMRATSAPGECESALHIIVNEIIANEAVNFVD